MSDAAVSRSARHCEGLNIDKVLKNSRRSTSLNRGEDCTSRTSPKKTLTRGGDGRRASPGKVTYTLDPPPQIHRGLPSPPGPALSALSPPPGSALLLPRPPYFLFDHTRAIHFQPTPRLELDSPFVENSRIFLLHRIDSFFALTPFARQCRRTNHHPQQQQNSNHTPSTRRPQTINAAPFLPTLVRRT